MCDFSTLYTKRRKLWYCQNVCDASFVRFGTKLHRQIVANLKGTNCAPLVADLMSLSDDTQANIIAAF